MREGESRASEWSENELVGREGGVIERGVREYDESEVERESAVIKIVQ